LDSFERQWYKRALPLFKDVKALDPAHPSVDRLIGDAQAAISQGRDRTPREILGLPIVLFVAVTAGVGLLVAGLLVAMPVRRRRRSARRRGIPAMAAVQSGRIPSSIPGAPIPAALETQGAVEQSDWLEHPSRADGPTYPRGLANSDAGASGGAAEQAPPWQPRWPPEQPATEPSAFYGSSAEPRSHVAAQPPPRHRGQHERQPDGRIAWSDLTQASEPGPAPVGGRVGRAWEHPRVQPAPPALVCWHCGHQSSPTLRFCEQCWNLLGSEE
jgi:hypothetical protein